MFSAHADVLKMAKTEERRQRIKWYYARQVFFFDEAHARGLELAAQCEHEDARFLVSIFPDGAPVTAAQVSAAFLAHSEDARCLCWAASSRKQRGRIVVPDDEKELMLRSAAKGYAWAQAKCQSFQEPPVFVVWLEKSVAQGEPDAMVALSYCLWRAVGCPEDKPRAQRLWHEAAMLGQWRAQLDVANLCWGQHSLERFVWLRRAAQQYHSKALSSLQWCVNDCLGKYEKGGSGRILFEMGRTFALSGAEARLSYFAEAARAAERAERLYMQWCDEARTGVLCWLWLSKTVCVSKDIRLLIADLIWEVRAAWSDREHTEEEGLADSRPNVAPFAFAGTLGMLMQDQFH